MEPLVTWRRKAGRLLRSAQGAFDLPSIITGVVVVGILAAGVLAAVFGVIPFAQDNGAKQDAAAIRTAEGVAKAKDGRFMDREGLVSAGYLPAPTVRAAGVTDDGSGMVRAASAGTIDYTVETDAKGTCYVTLTQSGTGKTFYATDKDTEAKVLTSETITGCVTAAVLDAMLAEVGGTRAEPEASSGTGAGAGSESAASQPGAALNNGGFEADLTGWTSEQNSPTISTTVVHSGAKAARLSGNSLSISSVLVQAGVSIPADGSTVLDFWYNWPTAGTHNYLKVKVHSSSGALLGTPWSIDTTGVTTDWTSARVDLTPYKGQAVTLKFDGGISKEVALYLDDVSVRTLAAEAPTNVVAWGADSSATVQWKAPAYGGAAVTSYTVTPYLNGAAQQPTTISGSPAATTATLSGLANGSSYTFTVMATNALGKSPESEPSAAIYVGQNEIDNGGFEAGLTDWTSENSAPTISTTMVHSGAKAARLSGNSLSISSVLVQAGVPIPADGSTVLDFWYNWPTAGTSNYLKVNVHSSSGALLGTPWSIDTTGVTTDWTSARVDLTPYKGQPVTLKFYGGISKEVALYLDDVSVRTLAAEAPTNVVAWGADSSATVQWKAPAYGGAAVTSYTVTPYLNGAAQQPTTISGSPAATTATVSGLANGSSYTFTVTATNALGKSQASAPSAAITVGPNAVANGGFEADLASWPVKLRATVATDSTHSGLKSVLLKGDTASSSAHVEQTVTIPSTGNPSITYWHDWRQPGTAGSDYLKIQVYSEAGALLGTPSTAVLVKNGGWKQTTADMSAYSGKTVKLRIAASVNRYNALYVDDIVLRY